MNILIFFALAAACMTMLWIVQSLALKLIGEPLAWPLRFKTQDKRVKLTSRVMIHTMWLILIVGTPLAVGMTPGEWFAQEFPTPVPWRDFLIAGSVMLFPIWIMYAVWLAMGWVVIDPKHETSVRRSKLIRRFLMPWPLATLEEAVFRGVVLEQLLRSFPDRPSFTALSIVLNSALFSSIHFVKPPHPGRPLWRPAYGLFIVGCLFGLAYVLGGRSLWLPIAVHGSAVLGIEVMRLYVTYRAPPWLIGYAEFPQSGLLGSLLVVGVAIALTLIFGPWPA